MDVMDLVNKLRLDPNIDDFREARYMLIELSNQIADVEVSIITLKEEVKNKKAELTSKYKEENPKMPMTQIESQVMLDTKEARKTLTDLQWQLIRLKNKYESVDKFLKSVDTSLFYLANVND